MTQIPSAGALKRTPLYDVHRKAGAKMVPFGGWEMPVQYTGIIEEHRTVRGAVGLFDISHMGEFEIAGPEALAIVQRLTTNDASVLAVGQVQYSLLCYPEGGIVDDLTLYRLDNDRLHAHSQRVEHRQGLGVGHVSRWRRRAVDERERGDGAPRGAGAEGRGAGRAARRHGRDARAVLPFRPRRGRGGARDHLPDRAIRARTASSSTLPRPAPRRSGTH